MIRIEEGTINRVMEFKNRIPEFENPYDRTEYEKRLSQVPHLILIASIKDQDVGFKIGYQKEDHFYSWLGGVIPEYRKQGIASGLAKRQESWAIKNGYSYITMKTWNARKEMLLFAIKNGFYITEVEPRAKFEEYRIWLRKDLGNSQR